MTASNPLAYLNGYGASDHSHSSPPPVASTSRLPSPEPPSASPYFSKPVRLEEELPTVTDTLVPLSGVVERVAAQAYSDLANLAETLPSTDDQGRKRAIVDYVLQTRRQLLKLLVLVRWSGEANAIAKCMNIIGFLGRQNFEFDRTVNDLTGVKSMLGNARVRNYDIPTALSVLTTGKYTGLPAVLEQTFAQPRTLSDGEVIRTLMEANEVLRWRLNCVEEMPFAMRSFVIEDARAVFRLENLWEASFAFSGNEKDDDGEWYLISLKFLFRVRDARGAWASVPVGPMKERITELCNRELSRRKPPIPEAPDPGPPPRDAPLYRAYTFIQRLTLSYQLEALATQAVQLENTLWAGHITSELSKDRSDLTIKYWTPPPIPKGRSTPSNAPLPPQPAGILRISFRTAPPPPIDSAPHPHTKPRIALSNQHLISPSRSDKLDVRQQALRRALGGASSTEGDVREGLDIHWDAESLDEEVRAAAELSFTSELDLSSLLKTVTIQHARESIGRLYDILAADMDAIDLELVDTPSSDGIPTIKVHLFAAHFVLLSVNALSGKVELKALGESLATRELRLRGAAERIDAERKLAAETLLRVRSSTIVDEVDSRAAFLGYTTVRRLSLRPADYARFGPSTRSFLFISLVPSLPLYYLCLALHSDGFRCALVGVKEMGDNVQNWLTIEEMGWLQKSAEDGVEGWKAVDANDEDREKKPVSFTYEISIEDLRDLHDYCVRRIAFFQIEQQLHARRITCRSVASSTPSSHPHPESSHMSTSSPYLVIKSADLLRSTAPVAWPNVAVQCSLDGDEVIKLTFTVRYRDLALLNPDVMDLPSCMTCDVATSVVTFTSDDVHTCVATFLTAHSIVARSIVLAQHYAATKIAPDKAKGKAIEGVRKPEDVGMVLA